MTCASITQSGTLNSISAQKSSHGPGASSLVRLGGLGSLLPGAKRRPYALAVRTHYLGSGSGRRPSLVQLSSLLVVGLFGCGSSSEHTDVTTPMETASPALPALEMPPAPSAPEPAASANGA